MQDIRINNIVKYNNQYLKNVIKTYFTAPSFLLKIFLCVSGIIFSLYYDISCIYGIVSDIMNNKVSFIFKNIFCTCCFAFVFISLIFVIFFCLKYIIDETKRYFTAKKDLSFFRIRRLQLNKKEFDYRRGAIKHDMMFNENGNCLIYATVSVYDKDKKYFGKYPKTIMKLKGTYRCFSMSDFGQEPITVTYLENSHILLDVSRYIISDFDE